MDLLTKVTKDQIRTDIPEIRVGYTVNVGVKIKEKSNTKDKERERIQNFEGLVIGMKNGGVAETITVRKMSNGVGVERIFPINSPVIASIEVVRRGKARRAKLNYVRNKRKEVKLKEMR